MGRHQTLGASIAADAGTSSGGATQCAGGSWRVALGALAIAALTLAAYSSVLPAGYIWDDDDYVTDNEHLRTAEGLASIWFDIGATTQYYPLVYTSFWVEYHLWELRPFGYHLVNVLWHALGAVLLWRVLRRLQVPGAWLAAAVFALHPVQVMSVAWITERKNVLSGVFYFAAALVYLRFAGLEANPAETRRPWRYYFLALVMLVCALLSKTVTGTWPAAILLVLWWKKGRLAWRDVWPLLPMFALALGMGLLTAWVERHAVGAQGEDWALSVGERCLLAGRIPWFYLGKLVWPATLTFIYPRWQIDAGVWWQYLYPVAAVALVVLLWRLRHRWGRGPLVAVLFFGGTLLPALGFFDVFMMRYSYVTDHWQYLASVGPITLLAALLATILKRATAARAARATGDLSANRGTGTLPGPPPVENRCHTGSGIASKVARCIAPGALLLALAVLTWRQGHVYADKETLWRRTLDENPSAWIAHAHLAGVCEERGQFRDALDHLNTALELEPESVEVRGGLGTLLVRMGRVDEGLVHLREARRLRPDLAMIRHNLAAALARRGRLDEAIAELREAIRFEPSAARHVLLGNVLCGQERWHEAIVEYEAALRLRPGHPEALDRLGQARAHRSGGGER